MSLIKLNADSQLKGTLSGQTISTNTTVTQNSYIEQGNPVTINDGVPVVEETKNLELVDETVPIDKDPVL